MARISFLSLCPSIEILYQADVKTIFTQYYWPTRMYGLSLRGYIPLHFETLFSSWNVLRYNTYIIVSCKNMKKIKNGIWLPWQSGKTPKKLARLCLCRPKYLKKGKWHKIEFLISFLNDMELWFKWSRFFTRYVEIHNGSFELSGRIFQKFSLFH